MPSQKTNPGDAEEKRYSCHRVDCVTLDSAHHCLAPKRYRSTPRHPQGYAAHSILPVIELEEGPRKLTLHSRFKHTLFI